MIHMKVQDVYKLNSMDGMKLSLQNLMNIAKGCFRRCK